MKLESNKGIYCHHLHHRNMALARAHQSCSTSLDVLGTATCWKVGNLERKINMIWPLLSNVLEKCQSEMSSSCCLRRDSRPPPSIHRLHTQSWKFQGKKTEEKLPVVWKRILYQHLLWHLKVKEIKKIEVIHLLSSKEKYPTPEKIL